MPRFGRFKEIDDNPEKRIPITVKEKVPYDEKGKLLEVDDDFDFEVVEKTNEEKSDARLPEPPEEDDDLFEKYEIESEVIGKTNEEKSDARLPEPPEEDDDLFEKYEIESEVIGKTNEKKNDARLPEPPGEDDDLFEKYEIESEVVEKTNEKKNDARLPEPPKEDDDLFEKYEIESEIKKLAKIGKTPEADEKRKVLMQRLKDIENRRKNRRKNLDIEF